MYEAKSFRYVIAIADCGSISEAASQLGVAQPSLSRYILKLEKDLGVELFDRTSLPIALTAAGRCYVEAGRAVLDLDHQLSKRLEDIRSHRNQEIRVGTGPSRVPVLIPLILSAFAENYGDVRVLTYECRTAELLERLSSGKLDLIVTFQEPGTEGFGMEELFEEKVELAVPPRYQKEVLPAMRDGAVDISLLRIPFVSLHEGQQLRNALDLLGKGRVRPLYVCEYQDSAMALVEHGFGATLVPSYWRQLDRSDGIRYYPLALPDDLPGEARDRLTKIIHRRIGIFYRKEQFLSEAEKGYIRAARQVCTGI